MNWFVGDVIQGGVWLVTCPVLGTPKLHYINRLGINDRIWNVIIYIRINYVISFCRVVKIDCFSTTWTLFLLRFRLLGPRDREARELIFGLFFQLCARRAQMTPVAVKSFRNTISFFREVAFTLPPPKVSMLRICYRWGSPKASYKRVFTLICWQPGSANIGFCSIWAIF